MACQPVWGYFMPRGYEIMYIVGLVDLFNSISIFEGYLMPKSSLRKNSRGAI